MRLRSLWVAFAALLFLQPPAQAGEPIPGKRFGDVTEARVLAQARLRVDVKTVLLHGTDVEPARAVGRRWAGPVLEGRLEHVAGDPGVLTDHYRAPLASSEHGTGGAPKGVMLTHLNMVAAATAATVGSRMSRTCRSPGLHLAVSGSSTASTRQIMARAGHRIRAAKKNTTPRNPKKLLMMTKSLGYCVKLMQSPAGRADLHKALMKRPHSPAVRSPRMKILNLREVNAVDGFSSPLSVGVAQD